MCIYLEETVSLWNNEKLPLLITSAEDLTTSNGETKAGFIALALEKNRLAKPYVTEAKYLKIRASEAKDPKELLTFKDIQPSLLTAAGVSEKASKYFQQEDKNTAIETFIDKFLEPAGNAFVDELVYRFLLIKGDSLGGSMRNLIGKYGEIKLTRALLSILSIEGRQVWYLDSNSNVWSEIGADNADIENIAKGISWISNGSYRTLLYNKQLKLVDKKNIDLCLLEAHYDEALNKLQSAESFLALGELKGGIDPAGADEHWKTANSALDRIRLNFNSLKMNPGIIFIGAAIEPSMAQEIYTQLVDKRLTYVANLTKENQLFKACEWLISL